MYMKKLLLFFAIVCLCYNNCRSQIKNNSAGIPMRGIAIQFLQSLSAAQKEKAQLLFDNEERYRWFYVPIERKGIPLKDLDEKQMKIGMDLLHTALSDTAFNKAMAIVQLENVLREIENASPDYRNPGNYYFTIFGNPADSIWGWRFEGHHVSFNFSSQNNQLVSGAPGFLGSNPAVVPS